MSSRELEILSERSEELEFLTTRDPVRIILYSKPGSRIIKTLKFGFASLRVFDFRDDKGGNSNHFKI